MAFRQNLTEMMIKNIATKYLLYLNIIITNLYLSELWRENESL